MKPLLRQELALLHEDLIAMTEQEYATVVLHQLWDIENLARKYGFLNCAAAIAIGRLELMPVLQATQPAPERASSALVFKQHYFEFVTYNSENKRLELNLPER